MKLVYGTTLRIAVALMLAPAAMVLLSGCSQLKSGLHPASAPPQMPSVSLSDAQQGSLFQRQGIITQKSYLRLISIQNGVNTTQNFSQSDAAFLAQQLHLLPVHTSSPSTLRVENIVLGDIAGSKPKRLAPIQRNQLYTAIVPFASSPDQWVQVSASLALASTRDPRAIPVLNRMAQSSPYPVARMDAREWLKQLQKVGISPEK